MQLFVVFVLFSTCAAAVSAAVPDLRVSIGFGTKEVSGPKICGVVHQQQSLRLRVLFTHRLPIFSAKRSILCCPSCSANVRKRAVCANGFGLLIPGICLFITLIIFLAIFLAAVLSTAAAVSA